MAENPNVIRRRGDEGAVNQPMRAASLSEHILTMYNRKFFVTLVNSDFNGKFQNIKYKISPQFRMQTEFLIDFKNEEFEVLLTTAYKYDALMINIFLRSEKVLPDGSLGKDIFYARTDKIDVRDHNFCKTVIYIPEESRKSS